VSARCPDTLENWHSQEVTFANLLEQFAEQEAL